MGIGANALTLDILPDENAHDIYIRALGRNGGVSALLKIEVLAFKSGSDFDKFADMRGHWAHDYTKALYDNGIRSGYEDVTMRPDEPVARVEAFVLVARALGLEEADAVSLPFRDADLVPGWAEPMIQAAYEAELIRGDDLGHLNPAVSALIDAGAIHGFPDGQFRGSENLTHAQMDKVLCILLGLR